MSIPENILSAYRHYSKKLGDVSDKFPFGTKPDNFGGLHLEISADGKMALVGTDRGMETKRQETYSIDELMYWIFKSKVNSRAFYRRVDKFNYEQAQQLALDEIGKASIEWRERLRKEQTSFRR